MTDKLSEQELGVLEQVEEWRRIKSPVENLLAKIDANIDEMTMRITENVNFELEKIVDAATIPKHMELITLFQERQQEMINLRIRVESMRDTQKRLQKMREAE